MRIGRRAALASVAFICTIAPNAYAQEATRIARTRDERTTPRRQRFTTELSVRAGRWMYVGEGYLRYVGRSDGRDGGGGGGSITVSTALVHDGSPQCSRGICSAHRA